jgi:hypothetical protein
MSVKIRQTSDKTGAEEEVQGSDNRQNVSARADSRGYYNSRDEGMAFSVVYNMSLADTGEMLVYWSNASPDKTLVISAVGVNAFEPVDIKLHFVTGTAASGTVLVPVNLNKASAKAAPTDAAVSCMEGNGTTPIANLTSAGVIDYIGISAAQGHVQLRLDDRVRLGQNDAIALEVEAASTPGAIYGVIFGYYE